MTICAQGKRFLPVYLTDNSHLEVQLCRKHDHGAYIRGWVEMLEWKEIGLHGEPDNPYSRHYSVNRHNSFASGVKDAYLYLIYE